MHRGIHVGIWRRQLAMVEEIVLPVELDQSFTNPPVLLQAALPVSRVGTRLRHRKPQEGLLDGTLCLLLHFLPELGSPLIHLSCYL